MTGRLVISVAPGSVPSGHLTACEVIGGPQRVSRTVPLTGDEPAMLDLPGGAYVVRAVFPSGRMQTTAVEVASDEEVPVVLSGPGAGGLVGVKGSWPRAWARPDGGPDVDLEEGSSPRVWARLWLGNLTTSWVTAPADDPSDGSIRLSTGPGPYAVQIGGPDTAWRFICLPPCYASTLTIGASVDRDGFDDGVHVAVRGESALAATVLGYMSSGQLDSAQVVAPDLVDQARRLFQEKMASPEGAAAAGYFLLRSGRQETIGDWPRNFAEWFGWLPDAAVIHASQLLRRPGVPDRDLARQRLLQATDSGVPRYTEGLRLLFQGLQLMAADNPADDDVRNALDTVRAFAAACDWDAVHTTFWAAHPDEPSLTRRTGWPADPTGWVEVALAVVDAS